MRLDKALQQSLVTLQGAAIATVDCANISVPEQLY